MRKDYFKNTLMRKDLDPYPFRQFEIWYQEAKEKKITEVNAMQLATATKEGRPSCRTVLLKQFDNNGLVFYTNLKSRKADEIAQNPFAFATFLWKELERQVCIEGVVEKLSRKENEKYFSTRPRGAQIAAWASQQGTVIDSRTSLDFEYNQIEKHYIDKTIPLPDYWGGYRLIPTRFEFWQGREHRLHDRFSYTLQNHTWVIERLAP